MLVTPTLTLYFEKRLGEGEDAEPLALAQDGLVCLAVFDGVGGADSWMYTTDSGTHSGAWHASRAARLAVEQWFRQTSGLYSDPPYESPALRDYVATGLAAVHATRPPSGVQLKGTLLRPVPTTFAGAILHPESGTADFLWAGDSRGYVLDARRGLTQVTKDDIKSGGDALENLRSDSPMSNFCSADGSFVIHRFSLTVSDPSIVLVATDGCFGYVDSPIVFEALLVETLLAATSLDDWQRRLLGAIESITSDDATMAIALIGWSSWRAVVRDFGDWRSSPSSDVARRLRGLQEAISKLEGDLAAERARYSSLVDTSWSDYRESYEQLIRWWASNTDG